MTLKHTLTVKQWWSTRNDKTKVETPKN